jgi:hypothetical protein
MKAVVIGIIRKRDGGIDILYQEQDSRKFYCLARQIHKWLAFARDDEAGLQYSELEDKELDKTAHVRCSCTFLFFFLQDWFKEECDLQLKNAPVDDGKDDGTPAPDEVPPVILLLSCLRFVADRGAGQAQRHPLARQRQRACCATQAASRVADL